MTKTDYVKIKAKERYDEYPFPIPFEKIPFGGEIIETTFNDGTIEMIDTLAEFSMCKLSAPYFIDRYCFTNHPKSGYVPFKLHDFQKEFLYAFQTHSKVIFRKSRQVGASVATGAFAFWRANFNKNQQIRVISLTREDAVEFKDKTIDLNYEKLPGFLKTAVKAGRASRQKLELVNGSVIKILPKSKNAGRGSTPSLIIIDEAAFNEYMNDIWKSIEPALDKGGDCIIISTTNGVGNWYHNVYTKAENGENTFHPIFIPWWRYPDRSNPWRDDVIAKINTKDWSKQKSEAFIRMKEKEQLDYKGDPSKGPWLYRRRVDARSDREFNQEIMAEFLGSGATVIPTQEIIRLMKDWQSAPRWENQLPNNDFILGLWCWKEVNNNSLYMLTVDTATGHGKDYSVMQVVDVYKREQVAEYKFQVATDEMGHLVKKVARYYNNAFVVIETNNPGPATFNEVYKSRQDPYDNCYVKTKSGNPWGWDTTTKSRPLLIDAFFKDIMNKSTRIYSSRLIDEIKTLIWSDRDKAEAALGNNDDLVMAWSFYTYLVDESYASRPAAIHTSEGFVDPNRQGDDEKDWEEEEQKYWDHYDMSIEDWHFIQDKHLPPAFIKWKTEQKYGIQKELELDPEPRRDPNSEANWDAYDWKKERLPSEEEDLNFE
jgi:hypothetical protein